MNPSDKVRILLGEENTLILSTGDEKYSIPENKVKSIIFDGNRVRVISNHCSIVLKRVRNRHVLISIDGAVYSVKFKKFQAICRAKCENATLKPVEMCNKGVNY